MGNQCITISKARFTGQQQLVGFSHSSASNRVRNLQLERKRLIRRNSVEEQADGIRNSQTDSVQYFSGVRLGIFIHSYMDH